MVAASALERLLTRSEVPCLRLVEAFAEGEQLLEVAARHRLGCREQATRVILPLGPKPGLAQDQNDGLALSQTAYNAQGYEKTAYDSYTLNSVAAKKNNGAIAVQFGGCDGKIANCLPIERGWSYRVRLYHPRAEILNGTWKYPSRGRRTGAVRGRYSERLAEVQLGSGTRW